MQLDLVFLEGRKLFPLWDQRSELVIKERPESFSDPVLKAVVVFF